jgi:hypothetical protein
MAQLGWAALALSSLVLGSLLAARAYARWASEQLTRAREIARHQEVLARSGRWIREGRMRAVLSERGATTWHLTVAAQHLALADQAENEAGEAPEFGFLADQHRLMHHFFMTAPLSTAALPNAPRRHSARA